MRMITVMTLALGLVGSVATADSLPGLKHEKGINDRLLVASVVSKIHRECKTVNVKIFPARKYLKDLKADARKKGYTDAEIDAYVNNKAEKAALRERRNQYFKSKGASNKDAESLCRLGREEIKKNTQIGVFLKAK